MNDAPAADGFDRTGALVYTGGDVSLLRELARLFLDHAPSLLEQIREAVRRRDAEALRRAAHQLRGTTGCFCAGGVLEAARRLEQRGRAGADGLAAVLDEDFGDLEREVRRLRDALRSFVEPSATDPPGKGTP